jgi:hypothetical protein
MTVCAIGRHYIGMDQAPYFPAVAAKAKPKPLQFDEQLEHFLSNAPTVPEFQPIPLEELILEGPGAPRRALHAWVLGSVAVCLAILAVAVLSPS